MSSLDLVRLGTLVADHTISPHQLGWICTANIDDAKSIATAIEALLAIKQLQPVVFRQTVDALFLSKGFQPPPTSLSSASSSTIGAPPAYSDSLSMPSSSTLSSPQPNTTPGTTTAKATPTKNETIHSGVSCDICQIHPIMGARFKCSVCRDFDLCSKCEQGNNHPAEHSLVLISSSIATGERKEKQIAEVIAICIDTSGSMQTPFEADGIAVRADGTTTKSKGRTRLEAVKQMFYGFRDQTTSFMENGKTHYLGLISYDSLARVHTQPTNQMEVFEAVVDEMKCGGSTAIFEAITTACKLLTPFKRRYPTADFRVLCLSDGMNNCRKVSAEEALAALNSVEACVDFLLVGDKPDAQLLQLVQATQGECYQINSLSEGFECLEAPGVISLAARRNGASKPQFKRPAVGLSQLAAAPIRSTQQTQQSQVKQQVSQMAVTSLKAATASAASGSANASQTRILKELQRFESAPLPAFRIFPGVRPDGGIDYLKVLMLGKSRTPYEGGVFELLMEFPSDYPFKPPRLTFVTPIYHYAVSAQGAICSSVLRDQWSPGLSLTSCLSSMYEDLMDCEQTDPTCSNSLRSWLSELKRVEPQEYNNNAREHTARQAGEPLAQACARITSSTPTSGSK